jgi:hypothetical protein
MLKLINGTKKAPRFTQEQLAQKHYNMSMEGLKAYKSDHDVDGHCEKPPTT